MKSKLSLLLVFISFYSWAQTTTSFTTNGTFIVPAGLTSIYAKAWGGGGSGGGASGAGLLLGRGAAGGGGGANVESPLTVVPGATLNVVVASQTPGNVGANGTAGGYSTITQYQNIFFAPGGSGGGANNSDTPPGATPGGAFAATIGATRIAGRPGGKGNSALLSLGLSSGAGGAGGEGINSGDGTGGAAISNLLLGTAPGNAGTVSGGGGSGAINSALGAPQAGGAGAAGRVILSYTCPTYSITSVKAVSCNNENTIRVTLTASATSLPVGNYVVTYNRTSPSATGLTANLTVSTAGTGTFTITSVSSNTLGGVITITKLASESCSSIITNNNTATIALPYGGTISGANSICAGNTVVLSLSGNEASVVKWQFNDGYGWKDVPNPSTSNTYTTFPLLQNQTPFRAILDYCNIVSEVKTVSLNSPTLYISNRPDYDHSGEIEYYLRTIKAGALLPTLQYIAVPYINLEGDPTGYSVEWDTDSIPNQDITPYTFTYTPNSSINSIIIPANTPEGTYSGNIYIHNNLCKSYKAYNFECTTLLDDPSSKTGSEKDVNASTIATSLVPIATKDLEATENKISVAIVNKVIHVDAYNSNLNKVFIYDVSGNLLYKKEAVSGSKLVIDNLRSSNQVLMVKVISDDNHVETKKIIY
ncbi:T9SS sorting signal type C domain-containing protein [Flavobacterium sp. AJR]|uniref:T9SS sorting signal type C domain-containing protein n=3 Tax=unclassified Flavobacterium TaxID=196869 RepID=UPI000A3D87B5|nr:T9SS sorting signal type C domain-containing protein [Flavobacterium sp. AJR]OUL59859.1 hypothetical protein B8T70_23380 [Flavobacterium sp. AJR]